MLQAQPRAAKIRPLLECLTQSHATIGLSLYNEVVAHMSGLLIAVGAVVAVLGLGSVAYGIPVKEFSFGNTLIISGTIAIIGGLIVVAIGAAIAQMRRLAEVLMHMPAQSVAPENSFEVPAPSGAPLPQPIPFPSRPKLERAEATDLPAPPTLRSAKPAAPPPPVADHQQAATAPMLRNPDAPLPLTEQFEIPEHEDVSLSPPAAPPPLSKDGPLATPREHRRELPPMFGEHLPASAPSPAEPVPPSDRRTQPSYFDSMWPSQTHPANHPAVAEQQGGPNADVPSAVPPASGEPAAILKSGVVDGMAYTLYVDGSIEAELPNGTLRFASINELREHLAKSA